MKDGKAIPNVPCTPEQSDDIWDNGATYVLVNLNGWRWNKLNVENGDIEAAIDALKVEKFSEALRQRPEYKAGRKGQVGDHPEWMVAFKEVKQQYDAAFDVGNYRIFTAPKKPWFGLIEDEMVGLSAAPALVKGDDSGG